MRFCGLAAGGFFEKGEGGEVRFGRRRWLEVQWGPCVGFRRRGARRGAGRGLPNGQARFFGFWRELEVVREERVAASRQVPPFGARRERV